MAPANDAESLLSEVEETAIGATDSGSDPKLSKLDHVRSRRFTGAMVAVMMVIVVCASRSAAHGSDELSSSTDVIGLQVAGDITLAVTQEKAFVILKPALAGPAVKTMVETRLRQVMPGVSGQTVATNLGVKIANHYAPMKKGADLTAAQVALTLTLKPERSYVFEQTFGVSWAYALALNKVVGAEQFLPLTPVTTRAEMITLWAGLSEKVNMVKLATQMYCGKVKEYYVINGGWFKLQDSFTTPAGASVVVFDLSWSPDTLRFTDFLYNVIGSPDPTEATLGSIVQQLYLKSTDLGVPKPVISDTGVMVSQSAVEAMAYRNIWLGTDLSTDVFSKGLVASGVPLATVYSWVHNPTITLAGLPEAVFDQFAGQGAQQCLTRAPTLLPR